MPDLSAASDLLAAARPWLLFGACVAIGTYAQNLTGFAFSLLLQGLVVALDIASVIDTANATTVLALVNAWAYFRADRTPPPWRLIRPTLLSGAAGVLMGLALLTWLSSTSVAWLRGLLGLTIVGCALTFIAQSKPKATRSPPWVFAAVGWISGVLGGLFSSSGPPLVYLIYRQPLAMKEIRQGLMLTFAFYSGIRLLATLAMGQFSMHAAALALAATPVVWAVTQINHRFPLPIAPRTLRWIVSGLLLMAGWRLIAMSVSAI